MSVCDRRAIEIEFLIRRGGIDALPPHRDTSFHDLERDGERYEKDRGDRFDSDIVV